MKHLKVLLASLALAVTGAVAHAGGYTAPTVEVEPVAVERAHDWTGFYAGASVGSTELELEDLSRSDVKPGLFAGYRYQLDNSFVLGAEASINFVDATDFEKVKTYGVEAQVGYAYGKFLPYAAVGKHYADFDLASDNVTTYAVGVDYALTERVVVGGKYTKFDSLDYVDDAQRFDVRLGWRF